MAVKRIPDGYHSVTPYLSIKGAAEAIEFYKRAFSAIELFRLVAPSGEIGHAEIKIGDSPIMLADPCETGAFRSPQSLGGSSAGLHVYLEDVDAQFAHAVDAGAKIIKPVQDQFYGDRTGTLEDPFGHVWFLATHKEERDGSGFSDTEIIDSLASNQEEQDDEQEKTTPEADGEV